MARRIMTIDEKIETAKRKYDIALDKPDMLLPKKQGVDNRSQIDAYPGSNRLYRFSRASLNLIEG